MSYRLEKPGNEGGGQTRLWPSPRGSRISDDVRRLRRYNSVEDDDLHVRALLGALKRMGGEAYEVPESRWARTSRDPFLKERTPEDMSFRDLDYDINPDYAEWRGPASDKERALHMSRKRYRAIAAERLARMGVPER